MYDKPFTDDALSAEAHANKSLCQGPSSQQQFKRQEKTVTLVKPADVFSIDEQKKYLSELDKRVILSLKRPHIFLRAFPQMPQEIKEC